MADTETGTKAKLKMNLFGAPIPIQVLGWLAIANGVLYLLKSFGANALAPLGGLFNFYGLVNIAINVGFILAGLGILMLKKWSLTLTTAVVVVSILWAYYVISSVTGLYGMYGLNPALGGIWNGVIFTAIIYIAALIYLWSQKSKFTQ